MPLEKVQKGHSPYIKGLRNREASSKWQRKLHKNAAAVRCCIDVERLRFLRRSHTIHTSSDLTLTCLRQDSLLALTGDQAYRKSNYELQRC